MSTPATPFELRDGLAAFLTAAVAGDPTGYPVGTHVYREEPDALVPPAYVVTWEGSTPAGDSWGVWTTEVNVECWPGTDLDAEGHVSTRDALVEGALAAVAGAWVPDQAAVSGFTAALETAQLGQQPVRIAVVRALVQHGAPC